MPDLREDLAPEPVEVLEQLPLARAGDLDDEVRHADPLELGHGRRDRAGIAGEQPLGLAVTGRRRATDELTARRHRHVVRRAPGALALRVELGDLPAQLVDGEMRRVPRVAGPGRAPDGGVAAPAD